MLFSGIRSLPISSFRQNYYYAGVGLLIAMHVAGFIGLQYPQVRPLFEKLVAFNLVTTTLLVGAFHPDFSAPFWWFGTLAFLAGYFIEVIGVHTGVVFGEYAYGRTLGIKLWEVPLLIGCNWLVLVYCTGVITHRLPLPLLVRAAVGAGLMVLLDYFIEPVAIRHDFWTWHTPFVPMQNYVAWFVTALLLQIIFHRLPFRKENKIAGWVYGAQLIFFIAHVLTY